jgi:hypothetical protein
MVDRKSREEIEELIDTMGLGRIIECMANPVPRAFPKKSDGTQDFYYPIRNEADVLASFEFMEAHGVKLTDKDKAEQMAAFKRKMRERG